MPDFSIFEILDVCPTIRIIDVGAAVIPGYKDDYSPLIARGAAHIIGFEPDPAALDHLKMVSGPGVQYLPYFIGDGSRRHFHSCAVPMTSSLYEPNPPVLDVFQQLGDVVQEVDRFLVDTVRLDSVPGARGASMLKVDVQGAEHDVLLGATETLLDVVVAQIEVEFVPLYRNQPLFSDVDLVMRKAGFFFHKFGTPSGRAFKPFISNNDPFQMLSQWLWADAVYVKSFLDFATLAPGKLLDLAVIVHELYNSVDLAALALQHYSAKTGADTYNRYLSRLTAS